VRQASVEDTKLTLQRQDLQIELLGHASRLDGLVFAKSTKRKKTMTLQSDYRVLKQRLLVAQTLRGYCSIFIGGMGASDTGSLLLLSYLYCKSGYAKMEGICPAAECSVCQVPYASSKP